MRRRLLIIALILVVPTVVFGVALVAVGDDPRVSFEDYSRVQMGMSQAQVESIFGGPAPRNERFFGRLFDGPNVPPSASIKFLWDGYEGHAGVTFDKAGNVIDKSYTPAVRETRSDPLTRRLHRLRRLDPRQQVRE